MHRSVLAVRYAAVVKYLHAQVGPRLFGGDLVVEDPAPPQPRPD